MSIQLAPAMLNLGTETAFSVLVKARQLERNGKHVVHMEVGEPDFATPQNIVEAGVAALRGGWTHYGPNAGDPELQLAVADYVASSRNAHYDPSQVLITTGGKPVMFYTMMALLGPDTEAIFPDPGYPIYQSMIEYMGAKAVPMRLREESGWRLDVNELDSLVNERTRLIILNTPGNPTGGVLSREDLQAIADVAIANDLVVLSDEIYGRLLYEGEFVSIASLPGMAERTVILDGFSKAYAMTGWRLGFGCFPEPMVWPITKLMSNSTSCTNVVAQRAGIEALRGPQDAVDGFREAFHRRRDILVNGLNQIDGISCTMPHGAFYVFPNISSFGMSSDTFADRLLEEHGVAGVSGTGFGKAGEGYVRFSYATSEENIVQALGMIREAAEAFRAEAR